MSLNMSARRLRALDLQTYEERVRSWAREVPTLGDLRLKNTVSFEPKDLMTDGKGNVLEMPLLLGKPCIGIPTAFLRHGRAPAVYVARRKEWMRISRCDRCKVRVPCAKLVRERLKVSAECDKELEGLLRQWVSFGGIKEGGFEKALDAAPHATWDRLTHLLARQHFTIPNQQLIRKEWQKLEDTARAERDRSERAALQKAWLDQKELGILIAGIDEARREREGILFAMLNGPETPGYLSRLPKDSVRRVSHVWWGREFARLTGRKLNPNAIARCMIDHHMGLGKSASVLRDAVKQDLERIDRLESRAQYNRGVPVWPKFTHPALQRSPPCSGP